MEVSKSFSPRPVVYDYRSPADFLNDLAAHYRANGKFSLRQRTAKVPLCSQSLVSQILNGKRQLSRNNLQALAAVFKLSDSEFKFIDELISSPADSNKSDAAEKSARLRTPKNHLLTDWINPFVKDLIHLKGFEATPDRTYALLQGLVSRPKLAKAIDFLFKEGFWRRDQNGSVVIDEHSMVSTNEIPNEKIRAFHRKALDLATEGLKTYSSDQRKASTVLVSVNETQIPELRSLIDSFQNQLLQFIEKNPNGKDALMQVTMHLTPVARGTNEK